MDRIIIDNGFYILRYKNEAEKNPQIREGS